MGDQLKAVQVLADLLSHDLPPASWTVPPKWGARLHGLVSATHEAQTPDGIAAAHDKIERWARFLGVDVVVEPVARHETIHLNADGVYKGVEIQMYSVIPDDGGAWRERLGN
ncbi:hypothetical protein ACQP1W_39990 [Spirillospora sp. CA-255316]